MADRVAQMVVKKSLEPLLEPHFHADSYGIDPTSQHWMQWGKHDKGAGDMTEC